MAEVVGLVASIVTLGELRTKVVKLKSLWDILTCRSSRGFTWKLTSWNVVPGDSPMLEAVKRGPFTDVMALISSGDASLYDRDDNGKTLLHYAVYCRNFDTAIKLIKTGHPVMETDNLTLQYGPRPEDWRFVWDNLVEEFAGEFWEMVESQPLNMPGAWVD